MIKNGFQTVACIYLHLKLSCIKANITNVKIIHFTGVHGLFCDQRIQVKNSKTSFNLRSVTGGISCMILENDRQKQVIDIHTPSSLKH